MRLKDKTYHIIIKEVVKDKTAPEMVLWSDVLEAKKELDRLDKAEIDKFIARFFEVDADVDFPELLAKDFEDLIISLRYNRNKVFDEEINDDI